MANRWEIERALMWSNLRPMGRLLVFAMLAKADVNTGVIPDEHTPSISTLADMTGITRCVIPGHLKYLAGLGWLKISAPAKRARNDRNSYALMVGVADPDRPSGPPNRPLDESPQVGSGLSNRPQVAVCETDHSDAAETQTLFDDPVESGAERSARQTTSDKPKRAAKKSSGLSDRRATTTTSSKPKTKPSPVVADADGINAGMVLADWIDYCTSKSVKLGRLKGHYAREIKVALEGGFSAMDVKKVLNVMFARKLTSRPSQLPVLLVEMQTGAPQWARAPANEPYKNPADQDDYDDWNADAPPSARR